MKYTWETLQYTHTGKTNKF